MKASLAEARRAKAAEEQAESLTAMQSQLDRIEAKLDQLLDPVDLTNIQQAVADGIAAAQPKK